MIQRFSSRRKPLDASFLNQRLAGATAYDRIAGYFSSSILEVAGEQLEALAGKVRIVCNSQLDPDDVKSARAANMALRQEWCGHEPEKLADNGKERFVRLHQFLKSGKLEVRVLPDHRFGLIHGKAGVITLADGRRTSFMGSANETVSGWRLNYELVWEDDSDDAVAWVQDEFEALWKHPDAHPLAEAVVEDIGRISRRSVIPSAADWKKQREPDPASPIIETPVYRKEYGLWAHQKYFVKLAFDAHRTSFGARYVLADMVGLGKTMQLAMSALLMALWGDKPILIIAPRPLIWQWQDEMRNLLDMPSAVWNGKQWEDENGIAWPAGGPKDISRCPRRVGVVSQGLFSAKSEAANYLLGREYECVIVDEAHRARRRNLGKDREDEKPDPNNLLAALYQLAGNTRSMLLATATPVQLFPVEAWDLLDVLAIGRENVLGNTVSSRWRRPRECLPIVLGEANLPVDEIEGWDWMRNPLPPSEEERTFELIRRKLKAGGDVAVVPGGAWEELGPADRERINKLKPKFGPRHNPFIRHIIRRTRDFLETTINPETNLPYLQPVRVELLGDGRDDALPLTDYLESAYEVAEGFSRSLASRLPGAGFMKTLLLRRTGSSLHAGRKTAEKILEGWAPAEVTEVDDDDDPTAAPAGAGGGMDLTPLETELLQKFLKILEANQAQDPKLQQVKQLLLKGVAAAGGQPWVEMGCIVFSQYFDSVEWLARQLSASELKREPIGVYAGSGRSAILLDGVWQSEERDVIKQKVARGELRLIIGTDAASEGLNLQRLGTLINLDLPWNPTRLEQRKGRIQRIGQKRETVHVYNLRYRGSVEDRVHDLLSSRLESIYDMFGQIPDTLEDVWIDVAAGEIERAQKVIGALPRQHPFAAKYNQIENINWESCTEVLNAVERRKMLSHGW